MQRFQHELARKYSGSREKKFENVFFEPVWRRKLFQMKVRVAAINSIKFSSKSELTSRFFSRLKFRFVFETSRWTPRFADQDLAVWPRPGRDPGYTAGPKSFENLSKTMVSGPPGPRPPPRFGPGIPRFGPASPRFGPAKRSHGPQQKPREPCACFSDYVRRNYSLKIGQRNIMLNGST